MKYTTLKPFSLLLIFTLYVGNLNAQTSSNTLLWRVTAPNGAKSHLFGTYHLLGSAYLEANPVLDSVWQQSSSTVVETVIDSSQMMQLALMSMMTNTTLEELLDSTGYAQIQDLLQELNLPLAVANRMKPIALSAAYALQLAEENTPKRNAFEGTPIDIYLASATKSAGKKLVTLETMVEQLNMLYNAQSLEEQAEDLLAMYNQKEETQTAMSELLEAYFAQDLNAMLALSEEQEEMSSGMDVLLTERNERWVPLLEPVLTSGKAFIAVGALHLAGPQGLISLLSKQGYTLQPVVYTTAK